MEIGTAEGLSALALKQALPRTGRIVSYDLVPWRDYPANCLREDDFADGRLVQRIRNLIAPNVPDEDLQTLSSAELIFVDGPKDGHFEERFLRLLGGLSFQKPPIVVLDDIRLWNMLSLWQRLKWPSLDLTGFGHWSGTGLCEVVGSAY